ncbi:MAG: SMC-Scp complex subunit ScpB [Candidatus Odinarchaeia archaeon]
MRSRSLKSKVEAALYIAGRPLSIEEISRVVNEADIETILKIVNELKEQYENNDSALEIVLTSNKRYSMQLKPVFAPIVSKLAPSGLLSLGALKTLSLIALKQPIKQYEVIKIRGSHSYKYIHELEEKGFIEGTPFGRTKILKTTKMFADYFGLDYDIQKLKMQLRWKLRKDSLPTQAKLLISDDSE